MKTINVSSARSQEKMTTWNRNLILFIKHVVKRTLQCGTLVCNFAACNMLHCNIRLVDPLKKALLK